jgi:hypothetical protein
MMPQSTNNPEPANAAQLKFHFTLNQDKLSAAEQKAQTTGQPLHVKAVNDLKTKAKTAVDAKAAVINDVEGLAKRLIPDAQSVNQTPASR